nr:hypothetical protein [Sedimentibacter sp.]
MLELFQEKLEEVYNLKNYTQEVILLLQKKDDEEIKCMIERRQRYIDQINLIDIQIKKLDYNNEDYLKESYEIKEIQSEIKELIREIINMDKVIRKNINNELKRVKINTVQPDRTYKRVNLKI